MIYRLKWTIAIILIIGALFTSWMYWRTDLEMRSSLLAQVPADAKIDCRFLLLGRIRCRGVEEPGEASAGLFFGGHYVFSFSTFLPVPDPVSFNVRRVFQ